MFSGQITYFYGQKYLIGVGDFIGKKSHPDNDYINRKLEGVMAAVFDTLQEYEERFRDLEEQVTRLSIRAFENDETNKTEE